MRYAEKWIKVDIEHLNLEKVLVWCDNNIKGKQFVDKGIIKFELEEDAVLFKLKYDE